MIYNETIRYIQFRINDDECTKMNDDPLCIHNEFFKDTMNLNENNYKKIEIIEIDQSILDDYHYFTEIVSESEFINTKSSYTKCVWLCANNKIDVCVGDYWNNEYRTQYAKFQHIYYDKGYLSMPINIFEQFKFKSYEFSYQILIYISYIIIILINYYFLLSKIENTYVISCIMLINILLLLTMIIYPILSTYKFRDTVTIDKLIENNHKICILEATLDQNYYFLYNYQAENEYFISIASYTDYSMNYSDISSERIELYGLTTILNKNPKCSAVLDSYDVKRSYYYKKYDLSNFVVNTVFPRYHDYQVGFFIRNEIYLELSLRFEYYLYNNPDTSMKFESNYGLQDEYKLNVIPLYMIIGFLILNLIELGIYYAYQYYNTIDYQYVEQDSRKTSINSEQPKIVKLTSIEPVFKMKKYNIIN